MQISEETILRGCIVSLPSFWIVCQNDNLSIVEDLYVDLYTKQEMKIKPNQNKKYQANQKRNKQLRKKIK